MKSCGELFYYKLNEFMQKLSNCTHFGDKKCRSGTVKVRLSENGFMKSSIFQKNELENLNDICLMYCKTLKAEILQIFCSPLGN